jgi:hypothetical protein
LVDASDDFVAAIAMKLEVEVFNRGEDIPCDGKLCIMNKGLVVRGGMIKGRGSTWGEDFVLSSSLRRPVKAWVLAFNELLTLSQDSFYEIFASVSADDYRFCRKIIAKMTVIRGIIREAGRLVQQDPSLASRLGEGPKVPYFGSPLKAPDQQDPAPKSAQQEEEVIKESMRKLARQTTSMIKPTSRNRQSILLKNLDKKRAADLVDSEQKERRVQIKERMATATEEGSSGQPQTGATSVDRESQLRKLMREELLPLYQEVAAIRRELTAVAAPQAPASPATSFRREPFDPGITDDLVEGSSLETARSRFLCH